MRAGLTAASDPRCRPLTDAAAELHSIPIRVPVERHVRGRAVVSALRAKRYLGVVRSVVALAVVVLLAALVPLSLAARGADTETRILYSSDWTGQTQILAVDPAGRARLGELTFGREPEPQYPQFGCDPVACGFVAPAPSPDGRWVLYRGIGGSRASPGVVHPGAPLWLARADGSSPRLLTSAGVGVQLGWAPDSARFAYTASDGLHVVSLRGLRDRRVARSASNGCGLAWSPDGRSLVSFDESSGYVVLRAGHTRPLGIPNTGRGCLLTWSPDGTWITVGPSSIEPILPLGDKPNVFVVAANGERVRTIQDASSPAWSPDGRLLAFQRNDGIRVWEVATGRSRRLDDDHGFDLTWSPDGRSLAYVQGSLTGDEFSLPAEASGDVRTVSLSGKVRVVVAADHAYGGQITSLAWTRVPLGVRYRPAVVPDGVFAGGQVWFLAGDADRVALVACHHVFVWTLSQTSIVRVDPTQGALGGNGDDCAGQGRRDQIYALALAGDRVAWAEKSAGLSFRWKLRSTTVAQPAQTVDLMQDMNGLGAEYNSLVGSGLLLAFDDFPGRIRTTIYRAEREGCPCPALRTDPGPLYVDDADTGRILAHGSNAIVVLDSTGAQLLAVANPVPATFDPPLSARLAGNDLVVLLDGELRDYDATTGALLHDWPLPGVVHRELQDAARGRAVYIRGDSVHLVRLGDGATATVAPGDRAGFAGAGLVYADGARLHLVPFDRLPLR